MIIVSDTSPLSSLLKIHRIELLRNLYSKVVIPSAVKMELLALKARNADVDFIENETWIKSLKPRSVLKADNVTPPLHSGELEAISLAIELKADWLLIDERVGRIFARQHGVKTIGLIGVLIEAKKQRLIQTVMPVVDELILLGGFWISNDFYNEIKQLTNE